MAVCRYRHLVSLCAVSIFVTILIFQSSRHLNYTWIEPRTFFSLQSNKTSDKGPDSDSGQVSHDPEERYIMSRQDNFKANDVKIQTSNITFNETKSDGIKEERPGSILPKTVLIWTKYFGGEWHVWNKNPNPFSQCKYRNCLLTDDKSKLKEASLLIFHNYDTPNFPDNRHQLYVHYTMEPPGVPNNSKLDVYSDAINMTINYRKDSTIFSPYGYFEQLDNPTSDKPYLPAIPSTARNSSVAWMVSHCLTNSERHLYVKELSKYIDINISGKCGNVTCPMEFGYSVCMDRLANEYKFYLAFENNVCKDYFSEKVLNALKVDMIPVVLGGADYKKDFPPRSYINVKDFKSPKDLAGYLHYLSKNETAYNEYLQWKLNYKQRSTSPLCDICKFLHDSAYSRGETIVPPHKARNMTLREWLEGPTACDNGLVSRWRRHW